MIGSKQIVPKTPIGGASELFNVAIFQQMDQPIFVGSWLHTWVTFETGNLTKCFGYCTTGTFTAKVYINGVHAFTVTQADTATPVSLVSGDGALTVPAKITCEVTACSSDVEGIYVQAL